jgi:hypothetical protein
MITLDGIIPYQPPPQLPCKPSQPFRATRPSSRCLSPLIYPLPQWPISSEPSPKLPSGLQQAQYGWTPQPANHRGMTPHANAFDSELVTLDRTKFEDATLTDMNSIPNSDEEQQGNNAIGTLRRDYIGPHNTKETFYYSGSCNICIDIQDHR